MNVDSHTYLGGYIWINNEVFIVYFFLSHNLTLCLCLSLSLSLSLSTLDY